MHIFFFTLTGEISNHECTVSCSVTVLPATSMPLMSTLRRNEHSTAFTENLVLTEKPEKVPNYFPNLFRLLIGFLLQWRYTKKVSTRLCLAFVYLSFPSLSLGKMKFRSDSEGANKVVNSGSVKARQWSKMSVLSSANDSGMYQPNLRKKAEIWPRYFTKTFLIHCSLHCLRCVCTQINARRAVELSLSFL